MRNVDGEDYNFCIQASAEKVSCRCLAEIK